MIRGRVLTVLAVLATGALLAALIVDHERTLEACRIANVGLGFGVAAGFFIRVNDAWARYGIGGRLVRTGVLLLMVVVAVGSAEAYVDHVQLGNRVAGVTASLVVIGVGLVLIPHDEN